MAGVGHLDDHRVNHRQVRGNRDAVIEEDRVLKPPILAIDIFLIKRPADPLRRAALKLPFNIRRMNCLPGILHHGVANDARVPGLRVHLYIYDMGAKTAAKAHRGRLKMPRNRPAGPPHLGADFSDGHRWEFPGIRPRGFRRAVVPDHGVGIYAPFRRRPFTEGFLGLFGRLDRRKPGGKGRAAAMGRLIDAKRPGLYHIHPHVLIRYA